MVRLPFRWQVFDLMGALIGKDEVAYLEFGVYNGKSLRYMASVIESHKAEIHGFDSFKGLPEAWHGCNLGMFNLDGVPPKFTDFRIKTHVGLFQETLPGFKIPEKRLVVNIDSDLYSSARCVLAYVSPKLKENDLIYFDEWYVTDDEQRAARDFKMIERMNHIVSWDQGALFEVVK